MVKKQIKPSKRKRKRWKVWDRFNQWCKNRTLNQKANISFLLWLFLLTISYQIFSLQTYIASWEVYRNSNLPYRIGERVSKKELQQDFITEEKHMCFIWPRYDLKETQEGTADLWTARYPYEFLPFPQRVMGANFRGNDFYFYEIEPEMDAEEAKEIMKKHGYQYAEESLFMYMGKERGGKYYYKGGIIIRIGETNGKVGTIGIRLYKFFPFLLMRYGGGSFDDNF